MYIRGIDEPLEYKRHDEGFYKGIVVKNNDPQRLYRVKIYIPELSNQPIDNWLSQYKNFNIRFPGKNNKTDSWSDPKIFEEIAALLPWAEPCFPLMGESGPGRYNSPNEVATISDTNYSEGFETNNDTPPTLESGSFSPSYLYENYDTCIGDGFTDPILSQSNNNNPYSYVGRPSNHVNEAKGLFSVPSVGSKVWVFHYNGDVNFPVYFGIRHDYREISLINNMDQPKCTNKSVDYPDAFENNKKKN